MTTGDVYSRSRQKCPTCGASFVHVPKKRALVCQIHKTQASGQFYVKFGRAINKRFPDYDHAIQFLNGLRFKAAEGSFDAKDYRADQPYAFAKLAELFLEEKKKLASFKDVRRHIDVAVAHWGRTSVKDIRTPDIKRFLNGLDVSDKTRANYRSTIHDFFTRFLVEEEVLENPVVEHSTPSLEIVVTDAAQADIAIRVPRIRIRVERTRTAVNAVAPIATADERTPIGVVHATSKPRQT